MTSHRYPTTLILLLFVGSGLAAEERHYKVAVDVSSQAPVEQALKDLRARYGITYSIITDSAPPAVPLPSTSPSPFVLQIDKQTRAKGRVPKSMQDYDELIAAAREGPVACYAWIYGKESPLLHQLQGHAWNELGNDSAIQQCRAESARVRAEQHPLGF